MTYQLLFVYESCANYIICYEKAIIFYKQAMILRTLTHDGKNIEKQEQQESIFSLPLLNQKGLCQYQNFATIEKISQSSRTSNQIKVTNKLCKQNGEFMQKITIVKFNNQVITIKDIYRFTSQQQQHASDANLQKRIHIFKKPLHLGSINEGRRRVTKNLPKNFIKAFLNYLQQVKNEQNSQILDCKMKIFSSRQKYNNSFIQKIVDDSDLQHYFAQFLEKHAKDWINKSKIRDKDVHLEAIQIFKKLTASKPGQNNQHNFGPLDFCLSSIQQDQSQKLSSISRQRIQSDKQSIIANSSKNNQLEEPQQQQ